MRTYRPALVVGGVYFFTVNLAERCGNDLLIRHIDTLRDTFRRNKRDHPFHMDEVCILPDHLHFIWRFPECDADFRTRWSLIKQRFSRAVPAGEPVSPSRSRKGGRGIWQRRYWEQVIRGDYDYRTHMAYVHYNPVKHGCVERALDWPFSSLRRMVDAGLYPPESCAGPKVLEADYE